MGHRQTPRAASTLATYTAALHQAAALAPDAVLLDLGLPGMDGLGVARRLREKHVDQPLLLVAMTGFGQNQDRGRTSEAGFDHHFTKPIDIDALRSVLDLHGRAISGLRRACEDR